MLLYRTVKILINLIELSIVARIILSFLNINRGGILTSFVYEITEPILGPSRELLNKLNLNMGMFDFSPIVAIFFLKLIETLAIRILLY